MFDQAVAGLYTGAGRLLAALPAEVDPAATRPRPQSLIVFVFLFTALVVLLVSMTAHMRRARRNLGEPYQETIPIASDAQPLPEPPAAGPVTKD